MKKYPPYKIKEEAQEVYERLNQTPLILEKNYLDLEDKVVLYKRIIEELMELNND